MPIPGFVGQKLTYFYPIILQKNQKLSDINFVFFVLDFLYILQKEGHNDCRTGHTGSFS